MVGIDKPRNHLCVTPATRHNRRKIWVAFFWRDLINPKNFKTFNRRPLKYHQLEAGGLTIGGLNRRLEEKAAGSRWFAPRAERPSGGLKPPTDNQ